MQTIATSRVCVHGAVEALRIVTSAVWNACILMILWIDASLLSMSNTTNSMTVVVVGRCPATRRHDRLTRSARRYMKYATVAIPSPSVYASPLARSYHDFASNNAALRSLNK